MVEKNKETLSLDGRGDRVDNTINYLNKWLPIETAPDDCTRILLATINWVHEGYGDNSPDVESWWKLSNMSHPLNTVFPTHWMPLPEPPEGVKND